MRLLVFFDLPVNNKDNRAAATKFRNFLISDGFYMIQFSVYGRLCNTIENAKMYEGRLKNHIPLDGAIRSMIVTEKQYSSINVLCGKKSKRDKKIIENQISFF